MRTYAHADQEQESKYWGDYVDEEIYEIEEEYFYEVNPEKVDGVEDPIKTPMPLNYGLYRKKKDKDPKIGYLSNPFIQKNKGSLTFFAGENMMFNRPSPPTYSGGTSLAAPIGGSGMIKNVYGTIITGLDDMTEGNHMFGVLHNFKPHFTDEKYIKSRNYSLGLMAYKQKVTFVDGYDFNLEAPGPFLIVGLVQYNIPFGRKQRANFGMSFGAGLGAVVTQARIPDYFKAQGGGFSPGHKDNGRNKPDNTYFNGYKFQGFAASAITRFELSFGHFTNFLSPTLTYYNYSTIKGMPIGNRNVKSYGVVGVVWGCSYTIQKRKIKNPEK